MNFQMPRWKVLLSLLGALIPASSCNSPSTANLTFTISQNSVVLINATTSSCTAVAEATGTTTAPAQDVTANYFLMPTLTVNWTNSNALTIQYISFILNSPGISGGSYTCQVAGSTLMYDWLGSGYCPSGTSTSGSSCTNTSSLKITTATQAAPANATSPPTQIYTSNYCGFTCGGISMTDPKATTTGTGIVYMYGTYTDSNGNVYPVTAQKTLTFTYNGVP